MWVGCVSERLPIRLEFYKRLALMMLIAGAGKSGGGGGGVGRGAGGGAASKRKTAAIASDGAGGSGDTLGWRARYQKQRKLTSAASAMALAKQIDEQFGSSVWASSVKARRIMSKAFCHI